MKYVLDTHAAIWNLLAPARLGKASGPALLRARPGSLFMSDVTLTEIARHLVTGKISVQGDAERWLDAFAASHVVVPVSPKIAWLAAAYAFPHRDPCDRHILATADALGLPLITVDATLTDAAKKIGVKIIW